MRDHPTGPELLALVKRIEDGDETIVVPDDERYRDLMMAAANAIAERQGKMGNEPEQRERQRLLKLLGDEVTLGALNRRLAEKIRQGDFDAGALKRDDGVRHLWETALDRVRESNPKVLDNLEE